MNGSIVKYFKSPKAEEGEQKKDEKEPKVDEGGSAEEQAGPSKVVAPSKSDVDRMIAENMASVLKSLKKKRSHKCRKRRRNEDRKEEKEDECQQHPDEGGDEDTVVELGEEKDPPRRSPRKTQKQEVDLDESKVEPKQEQDSKKMNAFQVMMSSRNKAIGSNSPGKDDSGGEVLNPEEEKKRTANVKRKLKLEEWAEKKGAGKRRLQEEAEEEFIANQMNRRAKRFKKLIRNMEVPEDEDEEAVVQQKESPRRSARPRKEQSPKKVGLKLNEKRGRRRFSSHDDDSTPASSVVETGENSPARKPESDEFVCKLNSPLKKKDSLLGYFNKVDKSPEEAKPSEETTPKSKRGRQRKTPVTNDMEVVVVVEVQEDAQNENESPLKTSGRPRRSCTGKVKDYAILNGISPEKESSGTRRGCRKVIVTPLKIVNVNSSSEGMKVVKSPSLRSLGVEPDETPKSTRNVKLAPLFVKKPVEDPEKIRARQKFLMSGIPEKMRLEIEKQRIFEESILNESPVFPLISHVQQLVSPGRKCERSPLRKCKIKIKPESPEKLNDPDKEEEFEFSTLNNCDDSVVEDILAKLIGYGDSEVTYSYNLPKISNVKDIVRGWKQTYKHFPVFKCYRQFKSMCEEHLQEEDLPPMLLKGRIAVEDVLLDNSLEFVEQKLSYRNGELLFTEKYKPLNPDHILVNCQPAIALKKFLSSWKEDRTENPYDSEDEFENSNSSMSSNSTHILNHIVLVGPSGCGKTSNVYAVSNEMNFNVLELNASSRRKGKIILQELQEATQSHQVRRKDEAVDVFKKSRKPTKAKTEPRTSSIDSEGSSGSKKLSLILIEDADIVFEQDDGFVAAINQLIATSKRPIVLTTTDRNCPHLTRFISNNVIRYVAPGISHIAKLLSIMALVENVHLDQSELARLYALNRKDLRKTINELQFFIQSGGDRSLGSQPLLVEEPELRLCEEKLPPSMLDDDASRQSTASSCHSDETAPARKHASLFRLFSRNQNEQQLIRAPINFDNLWCNMERVLTLARPAVSLAAMPIKRKKGRPPAAAAAEVVLKDHKITELEELVFFYENVSTAVLIQRDSRTREDRLVDHLEEEMAHELVERCWERWFEGELKPAPKDKRRSGVGAMCYDSLKQFDGDDCQTISTYIGINSIRTRSTYCDYEPYLRTICRCERERSQVERRGSRFYHYFRNFVNCNPMVSTNNAGSSSSSMSQITNFTVDHFDVLSTRFEEELIPSQITQAALGDSSEESR
ncbi:enhanced level of genomic instability 1 [Ochlerotatus camptorhynchus]|uniref:enhanced level of genomic instability 1 n=1 Tax=Ochlerotatus camptorhynchus TaxID=644619 RepID=UPI0031D2A8A9